MKKTVFLIITILFISCSRPFYNEFPPTDISRFFDGNIVTFPEHTAAWDVYNVITYLAENVLPPMPEEIDFHLVFDGMIHGETDISFNRIRTTHIVNFRRNNFTTVFFYFDTLQRRSFSFEWTERLPNQITISSAITDVKITFRVTP